VTAIDISSIGEGEDGESMQQVIQHENCKSGDCIDGYGRYEGLDDGGNKVKYVGNFAKNTMHGTGLLTTAVGFEFDGSFVEGKKNGPAVVRGTLNDVKFTFEGHYVDDQRHGFGRIEHENGNSFEGEFENNVKSGFGIESSQGGKYQGWYQDDAFHGFGHLEKFSSTDYYGELKQGKQHGLGVVKYVQSGWRYAGDFEADQPHGFGISIGPKKQTMAGTWEAGKRVAGSENDSEVLARAQKAADNAKKVVAEGKQLGKAKKKALRKLHGRGKQSERAKPREKNEL
jgi:hypothetical protein